MTGKWGSCRLLVMGSWLRDFLILLWFPGFCWFHELVYLVYRTNLVNLLLLVQMVQLFQLVHLFHLVAVRGVTHLVQLIHYRVGPCCEFVV